MLRFMIALMLALVAWPVQAEEDNAPIPHLKVGVFLEPPFTIQSTKELNGISIELWEMAANKLGWKWSYEIMDLSDLLESVTTGKIDIAVAPLARTSDREKVMDFTPSYLQSGLAIASEREPVHTLLDVISHVGDRAFIQLTFSLLVITIFFGLIMWWAERKANKDHFGGQMVHGFGSGVWWSMVTMSTVGYGDKAPRTGLGRFLALVWIFISIVLLAAFTGTIASSMTVGRMGQNMSQLSDLHGKKIGAIEKSDAQSWLESHSIKVVPYKSINEGLNAILDAKIDAFVSDRSPILWEVAQWDKGDEIVTEGNIHPQRISFALPTGSKYKEAIGVAILSVLESRTWDYIRAQYGEQKSLLGQLDTSTSE